LLYNTFLHVSSAFQRVSIAFQHVTYIQHIPTRSNASKSQNLILTPTLSKVWINFTLGQTRSMPLNAFNAHK
jgi:hypothetical protein